MNDLIALVRQQFPHASINEQAALGLGSFPEWDSLGHFNLLLLIEQHFAVRFEPQELADIRQALLRKGVAE
ncbi:acyl carrier protein [Aeromonas salmonicida subsp. salmonicida]|uniref:Acyl carrier protein n=2 Tax=Aeromonas salmonicida subsp. salmonicida TaxID=29491 RepID=A0ABP2MXH2_AERSS|nr:acyl carrier protein [Aeromonas salmonicida]AYO61512.1 acyl carrier protein [Aeromonas salmonicida subsp. salmonicida 01-B526]EHI51408.1 acyl carrier protein [Aeromonas salmonicida subsp. salmonicida 01-B526]EKP0239998.1 acyl carrier protein [Aeromonas salmonicida]EKP0244180.1 acyl carrier protein [Aeromonas salmonicida]EKP0252744.1 acyl carrier protein [Aeromonas salmonicida]